MVANGAAVQSWIRPVIVVTQFAVTTPNDGGTTVASAALAIKLPCRNLGVGGAAAKGC